MDTLTLIDNIIKLQAEGLPATEIAYKLELSLDNLLKITSGSLFKTRAQGPKPRDEVKETLSNSAGRAASLLDSIIDDGEASPETRLKAALAVLDRTGYGTKENLRGASPIIMISSEKAIQLTIAPQEVPDYVDGFNNNLG